MIKRLFFIVAIVTISTAGVYYFILREIPLEVETTRVQRTNLIHSITAAGKIVSSQETTIYAPLSGIVRELKKQVEEPVKSGDIILMYDKEPFEIAKQQTYAAYLSAKLAKEHLDKTAPLSQELQAAQSFVNQTNEAVKIAQKNYDQDSNDSTKSLLDSAQTNYQNALAQLARIKENSPSALAHQKADADLTSAYSLYRKAKEELEKTTIKSPQAGYLLSPSSMNMLSASTAHQKIEKGTAVTVGQALFKVSQAKPFTFEAEVEETDVRQIQLDQETIIRLDALENEVLTAKVISAAPVTHQTNEGEVVFTVRIQLDETKQEIKLGYSGNANFILERRSNVLVVPLEAVLSENNQFYVFVVYGQTLVKREVSLGEEIDGQWELQQGLLEGEEIVSLGISELRDGQLIK